MTDPRIYLAVDNCFASKRWTLPAEWMELIGEMGIRCVEASADNECDPLHTERGYLERWTEEVRSACGKTGVRVANLYSGTLEIFSGTAELNADIVKKMRDSVSYWRNFVPEDGLKLSELVALIR